MSVKKRFLLSFSLAVLLMGTSAPSHALIGNDPPVTIAQIGENIGNAIRWGKEKMMMISEMDLNTALEGLGIDANNRAFANMIVRRAIMYQDMKDKELLEKLIPDEDVCMNMAMSQYEDNISCAIDSQVRTKAHKTSTDNMRFNLKGDNFNRYAKDRVNTTVEVCKQLSSVDPASLETDEERLQYSDCFQTGKIYGGGTSGTLTSKESQAMDEAIKIMANAIPVEKSSARMNKGTVEYNAQVLRESRKEALRNLAISSMHEVKGWVAPPGTIEEGVEAASKMETLEAWLDERGDNWIMKVGGAEDADGNSSGDSNVYPTGLARKSLEIDRWRAELQFYQLQGDLRREALNSAMLLIMADDL